MGLFLTEKEKEYIAQRKELIDTEVELYKKEKILAIDNEILEKQKHVVVLTKQCAKEIGDNEHNFNSTKEKLGIEIAKLEAKQDFLKTFNAETEKLKEELFKMHEKMLFAKAEEIERLNKFIQKLIESQPSQVIVQKTEKQILKG